MKGICLIWSRGRHFSPSLPGDRYLNLGSKSDLRAEISGCIVWYDALAPCPEVLRSLFSFYANPWLFVYAFTKELEITNFVPYLSFLIIISKFKSKSATACNCLRLRLLLLWLNVFYVAVKNLSFFFAQTVPKSYFYRRFKMDDHQFLI